MTEMLSGYDLLDDGADEEDDFLIGATCNPNNPEECESCQ